MARAYEAETGNTLDITVNQADYVTLLRSKLNSGDIPDVFMSSAYADNSTYKDYVYDLSDEDFMKTLEPSALTGVTVNGRIIGYPFLVQSHSFIYNKKVFADAGITTLPRTIPEYEAAAIKLQAKGIQPFATGFKEWWVLPQTAWQVMAPIKDSFGGDYASFVDKLNSGALKFKNIKEMSTVFDELDLIKKYGGPKPMESDFNDQCSLLATGKVGMIHQGNWAEGSIMKTNPAARIGFLLGPVGSSPAKAGIMYDSNQTIRIAKDGPNLQAALAWLRWLTTSEYGKKWIPDHIKQLSPIRGSKASDSQLSQVTVSLLGAKVPGYSWYYQMFPTGTEQGLGIILQGYCAGQTNRVQTLDVMDASYTKIVNASK
jgi:raffinose/stachyose/melibiose transport system substrate-binding protein